MLSKKTKRQHQGQEDQTRPKYVKLSAPRDALIVYWVWKMHGKVKEEANNL